MGVQPLNADKDIQRLIEAGELTESEYYDNRHNVAAGIKGRGNSLRYQRMPTITIGIEAARAIASILHELAAQHGVVAWMRAECLKLRLIERTVLE